MAQYASPSTGNKGPSLLPFSSARHRRSMWKQSYLWQVRWAALDFQLIGQGRPSQRLTYVGVSCSELGKTPLFGRCVPCLGGLIGRKAKKFPVLFPNIWGPAMKWQFSQMGQVSSWASFPVRMFRADGYLRQPKVFLQQMCTQCWALPTHDLYLFNPSSCDPLVVCTMFPDTHVYYSITGPSLDNLFKIVLCGLADAATPGPVRIARFRLRSSMACLSPPSASTPQTSS
jgi:hypothetical protein